MTLDHPALWGIDASLEELRGKIGHLVKCAIQNSKVAWSNFSAKRCKLLETLGVLVPTPCDDKHNLGLLKPNSLLHHPPLPHFYNHGDPTMLTTSVIIR